MLNYDSPKAKAGARELRHYIGGELEQRNEDEDDTPLDDTQHPKDVCLPSTCLLNDCKVIGMRGMK